MSAAKSESSAKGAALTAGLCNTGEAMRKAPWPDFKGQAIHEGDVIEHPSGERGNVCFWPDEKEPSDQWRVFYAESGGMHSRLCLQIGYKGQAVVVHNAEVKGD